MPKKESYPSASERRLSQRFVIPIKLSQKTTVKNRHKKLLCKNISGGGMGIFLSAAHPVNVGDKIRVGIKITKRDIIKHYDALCEVVWFRQIDNGKYEAGLKFMKIKDNDDFAEFICDEMIKAYL